MTGLLEHTRRPNFHSWTGYVDRKERHAARTSSTRALYAQASFTRASTAATSESKAAHKKDKAALAAAGLLPTPASQQGSAATTASEAPSDAPPAGTKRGAQDENGGGPAGKAARNGDVPLQREPSMGDGELIDGVAGGGGANGGGGFQLNLQS